jgi:hypothetical protein
MKKKVWFPVAAVFAALILTACFKKDDVVQCIPNTLTADRHSIDSFIDANDISYLSYNAEGYYQGIANPGTGSTAAADSIVEFKRTISTFNGNASVTIISENITTNNNGSLIKFSDFQSNSSSPFYYLLTHAAKGGILRQIFPSSSNVLGYYGCQQQTIEGKVIPAYSQILVDIELITVKKSN